MSRPSTFRRSLTQAADRNFWRVFLKNLAFSQSDLRTRMHDLIDWLFAFTQKGAGRRVWLFVLITLGLWATLALLTAASGRGSAVTLGQWIGAFFDRSVIRHFLVLGLASFVALVVASTYLDDIFELNNIAVAKRFILQAALFSQYEMVTIKDGAVDPNYEDSPVFKIGGPGLVDVHLENAALFEKPDGSAHVVGPTERRPTVLDGFERLRKVVDLRDQVIELTIDGRTKDGIPVIAQDVRLVFSIYRGEDKLPTGQAFPQPFRFTPGAIEGLVYMQGKGPWVEAMRSMISNELRQFISQHTLSEFLTNANLSTEAGAFISRDELTNLFYDFAQGFSRRAVERGVELQWIGVGTWVTPSEIIPERHLEAWRLSSENRQRGSEQTLSGIQLDARLTELLRLIDEMAGTFYNLVNQGLDGETVMRRLMLSYREKLRSARELYADLNQPEPLELQAVLRHLDLLGAIHPGRR
ncbi:MAG: hypothetical protein EHM70_22655 [Chloroflexota bacterium]|nr:MAG: hypothetical protein EHM70_22655 [Chloroflexota bacterium]